MYIISDQSPFYITFGHDTSKDIIDLAASTEVRNWNRILKFKHEKLPPELSQTILDKVPRSKELKLDPNRVSLFVSQPGLYYRAHKDGIDKRFGINYPIVVTDSTPTCWYDNSIRANYSTETLSGTSRELDGFVKEKHTPIRTMYMQPDNPVLFNTDIYHDWDNRNSSGVRVVLTFRSKDNTIDFNKAKSILFDK